jgi:hypothetical protein
LISASSNVFFTKFLKKGQFFHRQKSPKVTIEICRNQDFFYRESGPGVISRGKFLNKKNEKKTLLEAEMTKKHAKIE